MMKGSETNWQREGEKKGRGQVPFEADRGQHHSVAGSQRRWGWNRHEVTIAKAARGTGRWKVDRGTAGGNEGGRETERLGYRAVGWLSTGWRRQ